MEHLFTLLFVIMLISIVHGAPVNPGDIPSNALLEKKLNAVVVRNVALPAHARISEIIAPPEVTTLGPRDNLAHFVEAFVDAERKMQADRDWYTEYGAAKGTPTTTTTTTTTTQGPSSTKSSSAAGTTTAATTTAKPTRTAPPTSSAAPPTSSAVPPTSSAVPPTSSAVPPTSSAVPPTSSAVPPTSSAAPPTTPTSPAAPPKTPTTPSVVSTTSLEASLPFLKYCHNSFWSRFPYCKLQKGKLKQILKNLKKNKNWRTQKK